jgi:sugar phosphate isomerase/epimerase
MPQPQISLQLWSLREDTTIDFASTIKAVAEMGYRGVETAGWGNLDAEAGAAAIKDAGLKVSGMHVSILALRTEFNRVVDEALLCDTKHIICPFWPKTHYRTADACRQIGQDLNEIGSRLRKLGFQFHFHNHDGEIAEVEGRRVFDWMLDAAAPENLGCEADVYWLKVGGKDPATFIREQGRRISLLHLKDEKEIGTGPVDFASVFTAAESVDSIEWYVIEVEQYNHPPLESVRLSLQQIRDWGKA